MKLSVSQLSDFIKTCQRCFARKKIKLIETYRKYSKQKKTVEIQVFFKTPVDLMDQTDLADLSRLGDENQDTDPHHFTSD
ncbi:hypothetical protein BgiMline_031197 [Biomphalaria glabrata]